MRTLTGKHPGMQIALFSMLLAYAPFTFATDLSILLTLIKQPVSPYDLFEVKVTVSNTSEVGGGPYPSPNTKVKFFTSAIKQLTTHPTEEINVGLLGAYQTKTYIVKGFVEECGHFPTLSGRVSGDPNDPDGSNNLSKAIIICEGFESYKGRNVHGLNAALTILFSD